MSETLFITHDWPRAIIHVDGDAFFTSCEEAIHAELRGKPIITGGERGIVACASYAAKALGIKRGVALHEAKQICPELVVLPSDYETYSLFSRRMFNIMRRFTPQVEEYSSDEAFADLTGMRRALRASYETIALKIQGEIARELGDHRLGGVEHHQGPGQDCLQTPETLRLHGHPRPGHPFRSGRAPRGEGLGDRLRCAQIGAKGLRPRVGSGAREQGIG